MTDLKASIAAHVDMLSREIGARPSGSAGCHAAEDYIATQMERFGLEVERQSFPCPVWSCEAVEMKVGGQAIEALANPYSPSCDVMAMAIPAATLAELENAEITGKIALLYGDLTQNPLACKSWFLKDERDVRIVELLEQKAPAAILTVQARPGSINRLVEDWEFHIPSATISNETALAVFNHLDQPVDLRLQTSQKEDSTANVVGRRAGKRAETIVFCAHHDTKIDTPGACDNASGVAAILALAEHLAGTKPEAGLEFVSFTNEEYLPIGDDTYLERAGENFLQQVLVAINFDGAGHTLDANSLAIFASSEEFKTCVTEISRTYPGVQWVEPWPESNHSTFSFRGVPALAFSSRAIWHYNHQTFDTARWISPARVEEAVMLTAEVAAAAATKPLKWLRQPNE